jgi:hypothetical protein
MIRSWLDPYAGAAATPDLPAPHIIWSDNAAGLFAGQY